ncbi:MAG: T9SS type A sorting domain-containing protein [Bacteroidia bacterium]
MSFGSGNPDVFEDSLLAVCNLTGQIIFGSSSTGNRMEGYCLFMRDTGATTHAITVGGYGSTVSFLGEVEVASNATTGTSATVGVKFHNCLFDSTATLGIYSEGFSRCQLSFEACDLRIPVNLSLSGSASLFLTGATVFEDSTAFSTPTFISNEVEFQQYTSITKTGTGVDQSPGPITSGADIHFVNTGSGSIYLEGDYGDEYQDVYLSNEGSGSIAFARRGSGNVVHGVFDVTCLSGVLYTGINATSQALSLEGSSMMHCYGGASTIARTQVPTSGTFAVDTLGGALTLQYFDYDPTSGFEVNEPAGAGRLIFSTGSDFASKVNVTVPRIQLSGTTFQDSLVVNLMTEGLTSSGALNCYGPVVFNTYHNTGNFQLNYSGTPSTYYEDVYLNKFGSGNAYFGYAGKHYFKKDLHFNGTQAASGDNTYMYFTGDLDQHVSSTNSLTTTMHRIYVDKPAGELKMHSKVSITLNLQLLNGVMAVDDSVSVFLNLNGTVTGGSDSSYVDGYIGKYGSGAFTFPVGGDGKYSPVTLQAVASNCTFRVEYVPEDPDSLYSTSLKDTTLANISRCGYWIVDRTYGSQNTVPTFSWQSGGCMQTSPSMLSVCSWNGSKWVDDSSSVITGNHISGTIKGYANITSYPKVINYYSLKKWSCAYISEENRAACECGNVVNQGPFPLNSDYMYQLESYVPDFSNDFIPEKTIGINLFVLQRSDPNGPIDYFQNTPTHVNHLTSYFQGDPVFSVQAMYTTNWPNSLGQPCVGNDVELPSSRIRFVLNNIYFLPVDNSTYTLDGLAHSSKLAFLNKAIDEYGCGILNDVNYFFCLNHSTGWGSSWFPNCSDEDMIMASGFMYEKYVANAPNGDAWGAQRHIAHELGHFLSLNHTYSPGYQTESNPNTINYLDDIYCNGNVPFAGGSNNNLMNGSFANYYYSPLQVGKMHRTLSLNKSIRKYVDNCPYSSLPIIINKNQVWDLDIGVYNDIIIKSGYTLTVNCRIEFPDQASLIIEEGAKLVLNSDAVLTSSCSMWRGVKLYGDPNLPQTLNSGVHGIAEIYGLIENAEEGIFVGDGSGNLSTGRTGGIVIAQGARFYNNFRSVAFNPYKFNSMSTFTDCQFICNKHLNDPVYQQPDGQWLGSKVFVTIWGMNGVRFFDNIFQNSITYEIESNCSNTEYLRPRDSRSVGIGTYDARLLIFDTDASNDQRNKFINLTRGIDSKVTSNSVGRYIYCRGSLFDNTQMGIYSQDGRGDRITKNKFEIPNGEGSPLESPLVYGAFFNGYRTAIAEFNEFKGSGDTEPGNWGLITSAQWASITNNMRIQRNSFEDLGRGYQAQEDNLNIRLTCNEFTNDDYEWQINPITLGEFGNQGVGCDANDYRPGNIFTDQGPNEVHIWSQNVDFSTNNPAWYYYHRANIPIERPIFANGPNLGTSDGCNVTIDPCPSGTGARFSFDLNSQRNSIKQIIDTLEAELSLWESNLDNGIKDSLITSIADTSISNFSLISLLKSNSPLSDTVLISFFNREPEVSDTLVLDLLSLNLPASKIVNDSLDFLISEKSYNQSTIDSISKLRAYNPNTSTGTQIIREIIWNKGEWYKIISDMENAYLEDDDFGALISFYKDSLGAGFEKDLFATYLGADSLSLAFSYLDSLPLNSLNDTLFKDYHALYLQLQMDSVSWLQIDSTQRGTLHTLASIPSEIQGYALAAMELIGDTIIFVLPENSTPPQIRIAKYTKINKPSNPDNKFTVYPNPSNGSFTIKFDDSGYGTLIQIVDLTGRIVFSNRKQQKETLVQLNLSSLSEGVYFCTVFNEGVVVGTERIVIIQ